MNLELLGKVGFKKRFVCPKGVLLRVTRANTSMLPPLENFENCSLTPKEYMNHIHSNIVEVRNNYEVLEVLRDLLNQIGKIQQKVCYSEAVTMTGKILASSKRILPF